MFIFQVYNYQRLQCQGREVNQRKETERGSTEKTEEKGKYRQIKKRIESGNRKGGGKKLCKRES